MVFSLAAEWVAMKDAKLNENIKSTEKALNKICKELGINKETKIS